MFNLLIIVYLVLGIGIGTIGSAISMKNIWRYNLFMKRKMLCIILILIITTLFCGVSFASREGELKEGIGQKENEIEQIKKEKDEALQEIQDLTAKISQYEEDIKS